MLRRYRSHQRIDERRLQHLHGRNGRIAIAYHHRERLVRIVDVIADGDAGRLLEVVDGGLADIVRPVVDVELAGAAGFGRRCRLLGRCGLFLVCRLGCGLLRCRGRRCLFLFFLFAAAGQQQGRYEGDHAETC